MSNHFTDTTTVKAVADQVSCKLGEEAVVLHLKNGVYYGLNPVGTTVWNFIQQPRRVSEIREQILQEYDVEEERCHRDLLDILEHLAGAGLVEVADGPIP
jgi:hypothetical protein